MTRLAAYLAQLQRFGIAPGLERVRALLSRVGEPQNAYPIALVGGTNGKGSTCEFLARQFALEGRHVGLYTSPHLYDWNERIRVLQGEPDGLFPGAISNGELDALFSDAKPHLNAVAREIGQPTEFETLTFLGLWHFARAQVDVAVVEVGLGGTWDATNVTEPRVSVLTRVALDHTDRLGATLELIARDKVGIARPNRPFITSEENPQTLQVLREECERRGAKLQIVNVSELSPDNFQGRNVRLAGIAHEVLCRELGWIRRITDNSFQLSSIVGSPTIPGRYEIVSREPLTILDGANNPDGARVLAAKLKRELGNRELTLVFGASSDKDWREMLNALLPLTARAVLTQAAHPRAEDAETLASFASSRVPVEVVPNVPRAVERARELTPRDGAICVCGSFFVLGEVPR